MGGNLYSVNRLNKEDFIDLIGEISPALMVMFGDRRFSIVPFYTEKEDFGDLDVVVESDVGTVRDIVINHFNLPSERKMVKLPYSTNSNVFSFSFKGFQIDMICTVHDYDTMLAYHSYNDVSNILGRFYHKMGLKLSEQGLSYPVRSEEHSILGEVPVSIDPHDMMSFLGLDFEKWEKGFTTLEDLFEWVAAGKYFDPFIFLGKLSPINEKRNKKRKTFSKFIEWIKTAAPKPHHTFLGRTKESYIPEIDSFFGCDINKKRLIMLDEFKKSQIAKEKFNGKLVMEYTGLLGKDLGLFLGEFKKEVQLSQIFEDFIFSNDASRIKEDVISFYNTKWKLLK